MCVSRQANLATRVQDCEGHKWLLQYTKEVLWPQVDLRDRTLPVRLGVVIGSRRIARCLREYIGRFIVVDAATDNAIEPGRHVGSS